MHQSSKSTFQNGGNRLKITGIMGYSGGTCLTHAHRGSHKWHVIVYVSKGQRHVDQPAECTSSFSLLVTTISSVIAQNERFFALNFWFSLLFSFSIIPLSPSLPLSLSLINFLFFFQVVEVGLSGQDRSMLGVLCLSPVIEKKK